MIIPTITTSKYQLAKEGKFEINGYFWKSISGGIQERDNKPPGNAVPTFLLLYIVWGKNI